MAWQGAKWQDISRRMYGCAVAQTHDDPGSTVAKKGEGDIFPVGPTKGTLFLSRSYRGLKSSQVLGWCRLSTAIRFWLYGVALTAVAGSVFGISETPLDWYQHGETAAEL